jgi:hypothetical protein
LGQVNPAFRELQPEPYTTADAQAFAKQAGCTILTYHLGARRSQKCPGFGFFAGRGNLHRGESLALQG